MRKKDIWSRLRNTQREREELNTNVLFLSTSGQEKVHLDKERQNWQNWQNWQPYSSGGCNKLTKQVLYTHINSFPTKSNPFGPSTQRILRRQSPRWRKTIARKKATVKSGPSSPRFPPHPFRGDRREVSPPFS